MCFNCICHSPCLFLVWPLPFCFITQTLFCVATAFYSTDFSLLCCYCLFLLSCSSFTVATADFFYCVFWIYHVCCPAYTDLNDYKYGFLYEYYVITPFVASFLHAEFTCLLFSIYICRLCFEARLYFSALVICL
jgi:hypothetical protein